MLKAEFIARTGYTPTDEEYYYIEQAYYDTDNQFKDDFCAQWMKDKATGTWDREMRVRKTSHTQIKVLSDRIEDLQDNLKDTLKMLNEREDEISKLKKVIADLKRDQSTVYNTVAAAKELLARL